MFARVEVNWISKAPPAEPQGLSDSSNGTPGRLTDALGAKRWAGIESIPIDMRGAPCRREDSGGSPSSHLSQPKLIASAPMAASNVQIGEAISSCVLSEGLCS